MIYKSKNRYKRSDFFYNFFPHLLLLLIILSCTLLISNILKFLIMRCIYYWVVALLLVFLPAKVIFKIIFPYRFSVYRKLDL